MMRKVIFILAILILLLSIFLVVEAQKPIEINSSNFAFPVEIQTGDGTNYQLPAYSLALSIPTAVKMGVTSHVNADLTSLSKTELLTLPLLTDKFTISVETRFDLINGVVEPSGLVHTQLQATHPLRFTWNLKSDHKEPLSGTLWFYLRLDPKITSGISEEQAIFAIPLDISVQTVLGMRIDLAIVIAIFGFLLSTGVMIYVCLGWFKKKTLKTR